MTLPVFPGITSQLYDLSLESLFKDLLPGEPKSRQPPKEMKDTIFIALPKNKKKLYLDYLWTMKSVPLLSKYSCPDTYSFIYINSIKCHSVCGTPSLSKGLSEMPLETEGQTGMDPAHKGLEGEPLTYISDPRVLQKMESVWWKYCLPFLLIVCCFCNQMWLDTKDYELQLRCK